MRSDDLLTPQQISIQCTCLNTQRAARAVARRYDAAFRPIGLTSGQFSILAALNQDDPVSLGQLADILGLERTTLTRNLAALELAGLVRSQHGDTDKRVRGLSLTASGLAKLKVAMPLWATAQLTVQSAIKVGQWAPTQESLAQLGRG